MSDWKEFKLGEIAEINMGQSPESRYYNIKGEGLPFLQGNRTFGLRHPSFDTYCTDPKKIAKRGEILFSVRAPVGDINIATTEICIGRGLASLKSKFDNNVYLFYLLHYIKREIINNESGTVFGSVNKIDLENIKVLIPDINEQNEIAEILSSLDDKIDLLHRQNKTLEQIAESLFKEKLICNNFNWKLRSFSGFIENTFGGDWGKEIMEDDYLKEVCCIRGTDISDMQKGLAVKTPIRFVKEKKFESIEPKDGDLILEISGGTDNQSTGRIIYIDELNRLLFPHPLIFSNFCRLIRPKNKNYIYFIYLYIQYLYHNDEFFNLENGSSGIKNLDYKSLLFQIEYLLPNNDIEILDINNQVKIYFEKINKNKHQIQNLIKLRDSLLPKLMSGEVIVQNNLLIEGN